MSANERPDSAEKDAPCRFGYVEHDGFMYCHEHRGFRHFYADPDARCEQHPGRVIPPGLGDKQTSQEGTDG